MLDDAKSKATSYFKKAICISLGSLVIEGQKVVNANRKKYLISSSNSSISFSCETRRNGIAFAEKCYLSDEINAPILNFYRSAL